jgi:hypothetical protein
MFHGSFMGIVGYAPFPWLERKSLCFAWLHWYSLSVSTPLTLVKLTHITALDMVNYALLFGQENTILLIGIRLGFNHPSLLHKLSFPIRMGRYCKVMSEGSEWSIRCSLPFLCSLFSCFHFISFLI